MRVTFQTVITAAALAASLAGVGVAAASRDSQGGQQNPPAAQQPPQQQQPPPGEKKKEPAPISMDQQATAQSSPEEEAAFKAFQEAPVADPAKKNQLGEDFIQKYPQSKYRGVVYQGLVSGYFATNQVPKLLDAGDKELALNPNDAPVLAVVAQTI